MGTMTRAIHPGGAVVASVLAALAFATCSSSRQGVAGSSSIEAAGMRPDPVLAELAPTVSAVPLEAGQWALEFVLSVPPERAAEAVAAARRITAVGFALYRSPGQRVDTFSRRVIGIDTAAPISGGRARIAATAVKWIQPGLASGDEYVMMTVWTDRGIYVSSQPLFGTWTPVADTTRLQLSLAERDIDGGRELEMVVRRRSPQGSDEYVTSRHPYAVRIIDAGGAEIWSSPSAEREVFVGPVLPDATSDSVSFTTVFDGIDRRSDEPLAPGVYRLVGEVRAFPRLYVIQQGLVWGEQ